MKSDGGVSTRIPFITNVLQVYFTLGNKVNYDFWVCPCYASLLWLCLNLAGAKIIKADDVTVKAGEDAELSCTVDGLPRPKVIWTIALADNKPLLGSQDNKENNNYKPVAPFIQKVYIKNAEIDVHQRRYTCVVRNTIIKNGVKTTVIDTATVKLTVQGQ